MKYKYTLTRDGETKLQSDDRFLDALKSEGWVLEGEESKKRGRPAKNEFEEYPIEKSVEE